MSECVSRSVRLTAGGRGDAGMLPPGCVADAPALIRGFSRHYSATVTMPTTVKKRVYVKTMVEHCGGVTASVSVRVNSQLEVRGGEMRIEPFVRSFDRSFVRSWMFVTAGTKAHHPSRSPAGSREAGWWSSEVEARGQRWGDAGGLIDNAVTECRR